LHWTDWQPIGTVQAMTEPAIALLPALPTPTEPQLPAPLPRPPAQASSDEQLIALWLHGRSGATRRAYAADLGAFLAHVQRPLQRVMLGDVQAFQDTLARLAPATEARRLSAVKSLLSFGHRTGFLPVNVGAAIRLPPVKQTLAERILDVDAVLHLLALERHPRDKALLRLLYLGGLRISEACGLRGRDMAARDDAGQVTVFGKGGKTRAVLLKAAQRRPRRRAVPLARRRRRARPVAGAPHRQARGPARGAVGGDVGALAPPRPCQPRPRPRRARAPRAGHRGTCQPGHHQPLRPCPAQRQQLALPARVIAARTLSRARPHWLENPG